MPFDTSMRVFEFWDITRKIGEGSYGAVYEIQRRDGNPFTGQQTVQKAALKVLSLPKESSEVDSLLRDGMDHNSIVKFYREYAEKLYREIEVMAQLKGNSHIVSYENHQILSHPDGVGWDILIQMELLIPLLAYTKQNPLTVDEVVKMGVDLCDALDICSQYQIIHRDIKPENIFLTARGEFKLGDFGIARTVDTANRSIMGTVIGTYSYMAPEVYRNRSYNASVDIYSLGLVMYRYLNKGRNVFMPSYPEPIGYGDAERAVEKRIQNMQMPDPCDAPAELAGIIRKACAYRPEDRYISPCQMRRDLEAFAKRKRNGGSNDLYMYSSDMRQNSQEADLEKTGHFGVFEICMGSFCAVSFVFILISVFCPVWLDVFWNLL